MDGHDTTAVDGGPALQRRGMIGAALGAVAVGMVAATGRSTVAQATQGEPVIAGVANTADDTTAIDKLNNPDKPAEAFRATALDRAGNAPSVGRLGNADANTSRFPVSTGDIPLNFAGVLGESTEIGVFGNSPAGVGVWAASDKFVGAWGVSNTGIGVLGQTYPATALPAVQYPSSGVLGIGNTQPGIWGTSDSSYGAWGQSNTGVGSAGRANHIGGWFMKGLLDIDPATLEPAALHTTARGTDVSGCFRAEKGTAVMAEASDPAGIALMSMGRVQSDQVGTGRFVRGSDVGELVPAVNVAQNTHVQVTLTSDPGAQLAWVELVPGQGFKPHLTARARRDGTFTYFIVEAMTHPA